MEMIYKIESDKLSVSVKKIGAELCSIVSKESGVEYMWEADPSIWGGSAPVLFPIIGCMKGDGYTYKGKRYTLPKHGFIRNSEDATVVEKSREAISLNFKYSEETLEMYPFKFSFTVTFRVEESRLLVTHNVENLGDDEMIFSLGGHPAFSCPFNSNEKYSDYYIEFETEESAESYSLSSEGLITGETTQPMKNSNILKLTDTLFDSDALMFKDMKSTKATLKSRVNSQELSISYPGFSYLGIWAKPAAPYVCIEPWIGISDSENSSGNLEEKEGVISLSGLESYSASFEIEISE